MSILIPAEAEFTTPEGAVVKYVLMTPELATALLDRNSRNRSASTHSVDAYARNMANDLWPFLGDPIRIAPDGLLLDGQHRLMAVTLSRKTVPMIVIENLPEDSQRFMDAGRKRSAGDLLTMDGIANGSQMAAIARLLLSWEHWRTKRNAVSPQNNEVVGYVTDHLDTLTIAVSHSNQVWREIRASRPAVGAAFVRATEVTTAAGGDILEVSNWFTRLATGESLRLGQPLHSLRGTLNRAERAIIPIQLYQIVRCWNAECVGESLSKLQLPKGGVTVTNFPDMRAHNTVEVLDENDEAAAAALERIQEAG